MTPPTAHKMKVPRSGIAPANLAALWRPVLSVPGFLRALGWAWSCPLEGTYAPISTVMRPRPAVSDTPNSPQNADFVWPHRAVGGNESNQLDLIHGCCACCLVSWPCPAQLTLDEAVLTSAGADLSVYHDRMAAIGWSGHKCGLCGGVMSRNPHPKAGIPTYEILDVGAIWVCVPCTVKTRHRWSTRALQAEAALVEARRHATSLAAALRKYEHPIGLSTDADQALADYDQWRDK